MTPSQVLLRLGARAPRPFRTLFALSGRGILPRGIAHHWLAEMMQDRIPETAPDWLGHVVTMGDGTPIEVDPRDGLGETIAQRGFWERDMVDFLCAFVQPGMTVLDVGANIGQFSLIASRRVGSRGQVHAFEPHPTMHRVLRRNLRRAGCANTVARRAALSDVSGRASLFLQHITSVGLTSLRPVPQHQFTARASVRTETLDDYIRGARLARVDLVKIDVEGAELSVLRGAERMVEAYPDVVLIVEFLERGARAFGHRLDDLEAWLRGHGFRLFIVTLQGLVPYAPIGEDDRSMNVVAARAGLGQFVRTGSAPITLAQDVDGSTLVFDASGLRVQGGE